MLAIIRKLNPTKPDPYTNGIWIRFFKDNSEAIDHLKDGDYMVKDSPTFLKNDSKECVDWANGAIDSGEAIRV